MMNLDVGIVYKATVLRKTDIGYMLKIKEEEVFLHNNQAFGELADGQEVKAFLYFDNMKRLTATLETPKLVLGKPNWVVVEDVLSNVGVFVNIGISKGILISKDYLPYDNNLWPIKGDCLFVELKAKNNQLVGKVVSRNDLINYRKENVEYAVDDRIEGNVCRLVSEGAVVYTKDLNTIFIHENQVREKLRMGALVNPKIILRLSKHEYNGTLIENKENMIDSDSQKIINYLKDHQNQMIFGNDSTPEEILLIFRMSKKAFKRALGHLYKERLIDFVDGKTVYKG